MVVGASYPLAFKLYPYTPVPAQRSAEASAPYPVIVIGAGPVGLCIALDLAQRGTRVLVLDDHEGVGQGSRAICFAKRTLEIADRLGVAEPMIKKGVVWSLGKVFHRSQKLFEFNLLPEDAHKFPAFINLQQPYVEKYLVDALRRAQAAGAPVDIRGRNQVAGLEQHAEHVTLHIDTPDGSYQEKARYVVACDGARSATRDALGLRFEGRVFEDNFLIADVKMEAAFPTERWFWFEPSFEGGSQSALLHKQPDNIWRIDFQLGRDIDRAAELEPARIRARVDAMLSSQIGQVPDYTLEWTSIYTFQCRRMQHFRSDRIFFAGDSAHQVSPFGARGANSGIQDADNLAWKLDLVLKGLAPDRLLDTYSGERVAAADENILNSTRATDFLTPRNDVSRLFRDAVLSLASDCAFARPLVNSGRLSVPSVYDGARWHGPDALAGPKVARVGAPCPDARLQRGYLLDHLSGQFTLIAINTKPPDFAPPDGISVSTLNLSTDTDDPSGSLRARYLGSAERALYLVRPDQYVTARWETATSDDIETALRRALLLET